MAENKFHYKGKKPISSNINFNAKIRKKKGRNSMKVEIVVSAKYRVKGCKYYRHRRLK